jgi:hypothetical protein
MGTEVFAVPDEHVDDIIRVMILGLNQCDEIDESVVLNVRLWATQHNLNLVNTLDLQVARDNRKAAKSKKDRIIEQSKRRGPKS